MPRAGFSSNIMLNNNLVENILAKGRKKTRADAGVPHLRRTNRAAHSGVAELALRTRRSKLRYSRRGEKGLFEAAYERTDEQIPPIGEDKHDYFEG